MGHEMQVDGAATAVRHPGTRLDLLGGYIRWESAAGLAFVTEFNPLAREIHADNIAAGWWSDISTGLRKDRNVGELLMLTVSEFAEGDDGAEFDQWDDKLPHRKMIEVELADAKIRILDIAGFHEFDLTGAVEDFFAVAPMEFDWPLLPVGLMRASNRLARSARAPFPASARHGVLTDRLAFEVELAIALMWIHAIAVLHGFDIDGAVAEKRAFNRVRADHQVENRLKADGKRY